MGSDIGRYYRCMETNRQWHLLSIQKQIDFFVDKEGNINTYKLEDYNIDNVKNGTSLLMLYRVTGKEKYWKAATRLREQLSESSPNHARWFLA